MGSAPEGNIWKTPRPIGSLGGFNDVRISTDISFNRPPIKYGSRLNQFMRYEKAPFSLANDYIQFTNTDGSFWRQFEIESSRGSAATATWKYMY